MTERQAVRRVSERNRSIHNLVPNRVMKVTLSILALLAAVAVVQGGHPQQPVPGATPTGGNATTTKHHGGPTNAAVAGNAAEPALEKRRDHDCDSHSCSHYCTNSYNGYDRGTCHQDRCWCCDDATYY
ncbi:hypothetical protein BGZ83_005467 [Gryganskiella cystojenkinii]|nr:hypothetical protein BGZ83_005467 [Gryganskiella cystojenkinii]